MSHTVQSCSLCGTEFSGPRDDVFEWLNAHMKACASEPRQAYRNTVTPKVQEKIVEPKRGSAAWRKQRPLASGVLDYFPDALLEVAHTSWKGNEQHHPGTPLHWDKSKSSDEADALLRHLSQRGTFDTDGVRHTAKVAWRALALLQRELDNEP